MPRISLVAVLAALSLSHSAAARPRRPRAPAPAQWVPTKLSDTWTIPQDCFQRYQRKTRRLRPPQSGSGIVPQRNVLDCLGRGEWAAAVAALPGDWTFVENNRDVADGRKVPDAHMSHLGGNFYGFAHPGDRAFVLKRSFAGLSNNGRSGAQFNIRGYGNSAVTYEAKPPSEKKKNFYTGAPFVRTRVKTQGDEGFYFGQVHPQFGFPHGFGFAIFPGKYARAGWLDAGEPVVYGFLLATRPHPQVAGETTAATLHGKYQMVSVPGSIFGMQSITRGRIRRWHYDDGEAAPSALIDHSGGMRFGREHGDGSRGITYRDQFKRPDDMLVIGQEGEYRDGEIIPEKLRGYSVLVGKERYEYVIKDGEPTLRYRSMRGRDLKPGQLNFYGLDPHFVVRVKNGRAELENGRTVGADEWVKVYTGRKVSEAELAKRAGKADALRKKYEAEQKARETRYKKELDRQRMARDCRRNRWLFGFSLSQCGGGGAPSGTSGGGGSTSGGYRPAPASPSYSRPTFQPCGGLPCHSRAWATQDRINNPIKYYQNRY